MKRLPALILTCIWMAALTGCGGSASETDTPRPIVSIVDKTADEAGLALPSVVEIFYEDDSNEYYFSCPVSQYIIVNYEDGGQEDIMAALKSGNARVSDLDRYEISYHTRPKK